MKKIPTLFVRDLLQREHPLTLTVHAECLWVFAGEGVATIKLDGTNVKIQDGQLLKRHKPAAGDYDEASYVPCVRDQPADRWAWEGFDHRATPEPWADGIYELVGPKIQGNPQHYLTHLLIRVVPPSPHLILTPGPTRSFDGFHAYFVEHPLVEGLVFHHPDGRLAKIKRRDFLLPWPPR